MRNRDLHDALREFALEAAAHLTQAVKDGAELPFDVVGEPRGGSILYTYQPRTAEFIEQRWDAIRRLEACGRAAAALGEDARRYLSVQGAGADAGSVEALHALLERLYRDASGFEFPEQRFAAAYDELERALYESVLRTAIVTPLHGIEIGVDRVDLGDGLFLVAGDRIDAPAEAVWHDRDGVRGDANVLAVLRRDVERPDELPLAEAHERFEALIRALRLIGPGRASAGPLAWGRVDEGAWRPLPLSLGGGRGPAQRVDAATEAELVELLAIVERATPGGRAGWALTRFEAGLERGADAQALSDYLLALEALFDGHDERGRGTMPLRVAALCADEPERAALRRTLERAFAHEARAMGGGADDELDVAERAHCVRTLEECVRAILRDVLCGYLEPNLKAAADDVLVSGSGPLEVAAADLRPAEAPMDGLEPPSAQPADNAEPETPPAIQAWETGVTASDEWADDASDYSAPV